MNELHKKIERLESDIEAWRRAWEASCAREQKLKAKIKEMRDAQRATDKPLKS